MVTTSESLHERRATRPVATAGAPVDRTERICAVVPFVYDLGGRIVDCDAARSVLESLVDVAGPVEVDASATRSWNLSYLASHAPALRCDLGPGVAQLAGVTWEYGRVLRIFPWLGVLTIEYTFTPATDELEVSGFYDALVAWKNSDYLPYLDDEGALNEHLAAHTGWRPSGLDTDLHRCVVRALRAELHERGAIEPRPRRYAFHDFRPCFVVDRRRTEPSEVEALLLLSDRTRASGGLDGVEQVAFRGISISSTGWSTVLLAEPGLEADVRAVLDLHGLVHAQWFLCQAWISTYDTDTLSADPARGQQQAEEIARTQLTLARDLVEVDNLDLMLKDPALLRVARSLGTAFGLLNHREAAERRLKVLDDYSRQGAEITQARDAQRLQILFSLSAAGTIAGLIPAVAAQQSSWVLALATIVVGLALWLGFAVNFAMLLKRRSAAARARRTTAVRGRRSIRRTAES